MVKEITVCVYKNGSVLIAVSLGEGCAILYIVFPKLEMFLSKTLRI